MSLISSSSGGCRSWLQRLMVLCTITMTISVSGFDKVASLQNLVNDKGYVTLEGLNEYRTYVLDGPRPYHLFLFFTASQPKFKCDICTAMMPEFTSLTESFTVAKTPGAKQDGMPVFFVRLEFQDNRNVFNVHGFTSVPQLVYRGPENHAIEMTSEKLTFEPSDMYQVYSQGTDAENLLNFVSTKTGIKFDIIRSMVLAYMVLTALLVTICGMSYVFLSNMEYYLKKIRSVYLWMFCSLLIYCLSVSGMVYCIIRNPQSYGMDRYGNVNYFHPQGRAQYVYEGLIVGGMNAICALSIINLSESYKRKWSQTPLVMVLSMVSFFLMYVQISSAYAYKNPWFKQNSWF